MLARSCELLASASTAAALLAELPWAPPERLGVALAATSPSQVWRQGHTLCQVPADMTKHSEWGLYPARTLSGRSHISCTAQEDGCNYSIGHVRRHSSQHEQKSPRCGQDACCNSSPLDLYTVQQAVPDVHAQAVNYLIN